MIYHPKQIKPEPYGKYNKILVPKKEYDLCKTASLNFWSNSKTGTYGSGLCNSYQDPTAATRTGLLGQMAFGKLLGIQVDLTYQEKGDKYDTLLGLLTADFKCATRNYNQGLIYHRSESGYQIPLDKDLYAFSFLEYDNKISQEASVILVGYATKQDILDKATVEPGKTKNSKHLNYVINYKDLNSIQELVELAKNAKFAAKF